MRAAQGPQARFGRSPQGLHREGRRPYSPIRSGDQDSPQARPAGGEGFHALARSAQQFAAPRRKREAELGRDSGLRVAREEFAKYRFSGAEPIDGRDVEVSDACIERGLEQREGGAARGTSGKAPASEPEPRGGASTRQRRVHAAAP
jgi:hypothetical protein